MKRIAAILLALVLFTCSSAFASPSSSFLTAFDNATWLILEINSSGSGLKCDGAYDDPSTNTIAIALHAEDYSYAQIREMKELDPGLYASLVDSYQALSDEFNGACDFDPNEKINVVFTVMSSDGVGLFLTVNDLDLTWMLCDY